MRALTLTYILLLAPLATGQLPTTHQDFIQPGTQPSTLNTEIVYSTDCFGCHGYIDIDEEPYRPWTASMMAQSTRDPIFHACLAIAEQDAPHSGDLCLRCHAPGAWLAGRSVPSDGTGLVAALGDFDGVSCNLCHRMVDPVYSAENPAEDPGILAAISAGPGGGTGGMIPTEPHTGQFVIDPEDRRRGPYNLVSMFFHQWRESPYHRESKLCSTCHDVSNPAFTRSASGSYDLNPVNTEHPTHLKEDEFPIERTYSEWSQSEYAVRPVDTGGLFGGNQPEVSSCQDCHMPKTEGYGCRPDLGGNFRTDLGQHHFNGANSWVLDAVRTLYSDNDTGLSDETVVGAHARTTAMMQNAGEIRTFERNGELIVRVKNETGHKLPTGYHEGRRMWVNVQYLDVNGNVIDERGAYDLATATLSTSDTTIYEARYGLDSNMSAVTGLPAGESFHFALNNTVVKDNRIPPRGYTLDGFTSVQAAPVGTNYPEHHYWHDSNFSLNSAAASVIVKLYHQTTTREYVEFLRDENTTNNAGQVAYDQWVLHGESEPQLMDQTTLYLGSGACPPPIIYGIGKTTSVGTEPKLTWSGTPSVTGGSFMLQLADLPANKPVLGFWATAPNDVPLFGGTLLLKQPVYRLSVTFTDGTGAGSIPVPLTASAIGQERYYQAWFRDPQEVIHKVGLTNALHVDVCP